MIVRSWRLWLWLVISSEILKNKGLDACLEQQLNNYAILYKFDLKSMSASADKLSYGKLNTTELKIMGEFVDSMSVAERTTRQTVCTAVVAGAIYTGTAIILQTVGFGRKGPIKGRLAPKVQSLIDRYGISNRIKKMTFGRLQRAGMKGVALAAINVGTISVLCGLDPVMTNEISLRFEKSFEHACGKNGRKCIATANEYYDKALIEASEFGQSVLGKEKFAKVVSLTDDAIGTVSNATHVAFDFAEDKLDELMATDAMQASLKVVDKGITDSLDFVESCTGNMTLCWNNLTRSMFGSSVART